jgi:hypothetical protein
MYQSTRIDEENFSSWIRKFQQTLSLNQEGFKIEIRLENEARSVSTDLKSQSRRIGFALEFVEKQTEFQQTLSLNQEGYTFP